MPPDPLGILLISASHDRAHYAFMLATGAAAIGRPVVLFATNAGCHALSHAFDGQHAASDARLAATGVADLPELRAAAQDLAVRLLACDSGLRIAGLETTALLPGVEVAGIPTFLSAVAAGQIVTL